jgi:cytochrome c
MFPTDLDAGVWRCARVLALLLVSALAACSTSLPDPDSPGAHLYTEKCSPCHRLYAPGLLTSEMWRVQVARMQEEMRRRGMPPLDSSELEALLTYLNAHAG